MVPPTILCEHGLALILLWGCVGLTGFALLPWLRCGIGWVGAPLLGVVYWSLTLYLLPFSGGMDVAAVLAAILGACGLVSWYRTRRGQAEPAGLVREPVRSGWLWRQCPRSAVILGLGSLPYVSTLCCHYVPLGMDASMHTTAATLIARSRGLPADYAPFAPDVPFPAVNLGLPACAAVAIRCGGDPAAVMLASHHLTFTALILATYLLLRWWTAKTSAAVLSVASAWLARASQASLEWGGFPTVLSVAVGIFAARLLLGLGRTPSARRSFAAGAAIAAIPLIHGVGGGTWIYCVLAWVLVINLIQAPSRRAAVLAHAGAAAWALILLMVYRWTGTLQVEQAELEETRRFVQVFASRREGLAAWLDAWWFIRKDSGGLIVVIGWAATALLALRRPGQALLLVAAWCGLATVVANSRWYVLPGSFLLYPDRVIYWSAPLAAVALALCWREVPPGWRCRAVPVLAGTTLLVAAAYFQNNYYQKIVRNPSVDADRWEALVWAREHLHAHEHFVMARYPGAGAFLPAVAQVACSGAHQHHFIGRYVTQANARRTPTHQFLEDVPADVGTLTGSVVFRNQAVTIVQLGVPGRSGDCP
jgi:hypothetical protein